MIGPAVIDTLLPHAPQARTVGRLLSADAAMRAHDGDIDGALDSCRAIVAAGRSIGDDPFLISQIVRMAIVEVGLKATSRVLGQGEASDAASLACRTFFSTSTVNRFCLLEQKESEPYWRRSSGGFARVRFRSRRSATGELARNHSPSAVTPLERLAYDEQQVLALQWMNRAVAIARRPADDARPLWKAWDAEIERVTAHPLGRYMTTVTNLMTPHVSAGASAFSRYQTELGAHAILVAAERHRRKTGDWPTTIASIDHGILPKRAHRPILRQGVSPGAPGWCARDLLCRPEWDRRARLIRSPDVAIRWAR